MGVSTSHMASQVVFTIRQTVDISKQKLTAIDHSESPVARCLEKKYKLHNKIGTKITRFVVMPVLMIISIPELYTSWLCKLDGFLMKLTNF